MTILLLFFFTIWMPFISFSFQISVSVTSNTMLNTSGTCEHPCLFSDLQGNTLRFSSLRMMFAVGLSYMAFTVLSYVPSVLIWLIVFIISGCGILWKAFNESVEVIIWFVSFVNMLLNVAWFADIELSLYAWDKCYLLTVHGVFSVLLNLVF